MKKQQSKAQTSPAMIAGICGFMLIVCAIALNAGHFLAFFSLEGLIVVGGGVLAVACMSHHENDVQAALRAIRDMFREQPANQDSLPRDMADILVWAHIVKRKGLRGLEVNITNYRANDPFVRYGLNMVISNYTPAEVRAMMETAADATFERDSTPAHVMQSMASHAPAFGMIGTLIGMVTMLWSLGDNVANIGSTLAIAFLSTLYGVVSARMLYMPAAARLMRKVETARFRNQLITEGMVMLVENKPQLYIQDRLNSFLRPEIQEAAGVFAQKQAVMRLEALRA